MDCPLCGGRESRPFRRARAVVVLRCRCGLVRAAPGTPAEPYDGRYFDDRWGRREDALAAMKKRTYLGALEHVRREAPAARRVLDVGCALGWSLDAIRDAGLEAAGVEINEDAVRRVRARHDVRRDLAEFPADAFDAVTGIDVIEHVTEPGAFLDGLRRVLRPGGVLVLTTPDVSGATARLLGGRWPHYVPEHVVYFNRATIRESLRRAGFTPRFVGPFWKSMRADYVAAVLGHRDIALFGPVRRALRALPGLRFRVCFGEMCAVARKGGSP